MTATTEAPDQAPATDAPKPQTAAACLTEIMRRVESISKNRENTDGAKFFFRGIDDVMNTVGPLLREVGLLCIPELTWLDSAQVEYGRNKTLGFRTRVKVRYTFIGPDGSKLVVGPTPGEAIDSGDKGTTKAMSVAFRSMFLQTLCVPTNEPDPDETTYEIARPEPASSDPGTVADLERKIAGAKTRAEVEKIYKTDARKAAESSKITLTEGERLAGLMKLRVQEIEGQALVGTDSQPQAGEEVRP